MSDREKLIVANCSGFYGDRLSAAAEMVRGGPIDVLTGDYLAELTMAMLFQKKLKRPETGYVNTFLKQMDEVMGECLQRGIKIVTNAGGLNPQGMAEALQETASKLGLNPKIAWIDGDDLMPRMDELGQAGETFNHLDKGTPLSEAGVSPVTANAYLGCFGIKEALDRGADIVVCPRVTDAAVVMGPAAWKFNWQRDDYDALAGALAAGHIIECGAQASGGNYAFFEEVPDFNNVGFPIAEMHADGSCVITKHPGTGGLVSWARSRRSCCMKSAHRNTSTRTSPATSTPCGWNRKAPTASWSPTARAQPRRPATRSASTPWAGTATA